MTKLIKIKIFSVITFFIIINSVFASSFSAEKDFVSNFADSAINILSDKEILDGEKNSKFTDLVMSAIDLNLISKFVLSKTLEKCK